MKSNALITNKLFPQALDYLNEHIDCEIGSEERKLTKEEIIQKIRDKEGLLPLLVDTIDKEIMDAAPALKIIANCAVGYNNIDIDHAQKKGILVTNTPGVLTDTTADLTWALLLAVARLIPQSDKFTRERKFKEWKLDLFLGKEVTGKRLGIVGLGRIGKAVALRAKAFNMEIVYNDPQRLSPEEEKKINAFFLPLDDLLSTSDYVTLHTTLTPQTFHLISEEKIKLMKTESILINVSRGPVIDEKALARALEKKEIWGAGLDVYEREPEIEEELFSLDNVVLLPHLGSASYETRLKMAMMAAKNLVQGLKGEKPDNLVV